MILKKIYAELREIRRELQAIHSSAEHPKANLDAESIVGAIRDSASKDQAKQSMK